MGNLDQELLLTFDRLFGTHSLLWDLANNSLIRGFPIFVSLVGLWFAGECRERQSRMLAGLVGVCVATVLSVWFQFHVPVHTRPLLDPALHLQSVAVLKTWDRTSSFPSDTATLFFGLAAVVFLENRIIGFFCFVWAGAIIAFPRIAFGFHYPSDIIGSLIWGPACVYVFSKSPYPRTLFERTLVLFRNQMFVVHALLFVFLAEASNLFLSLESLGKDFVNLIHFAPATHG